MIILRFHELFCIILFVFISAISSENHRIYYIISYPHIVLDTISDILIFIKKSNRIFLLLLWDKYKR